MALAATHGVMHVTLMDNQGDVSVLRLRLKDTAFADIATNLAAYMATMVDLATITTAQITSVFIGTEYTDPGYGAAGSAVEENAVVSTKLSDPSKFGVLRIPSPTSGIFLAGPGEDANKLDRADADLIAWLANFYAATPNLFTTSDGETIANPATLGNFKGRRVYRHSRKRAPK